MLEKVVSVFFHLAGVHQWGEGRFEELYNNLVNQQVFPGQLVKTIHMRNRLQCDHGPILEENILNPQSVDFQLLVEDILSDNRLKQLQKSAHIISTSLLESYHSLAISYRPKRYHL